MNAWRDAAEFIDAAKTADKNWLMVGISILKSPIPLVPTALHHAMHTEHKQTGTRGEP